MSPQAQFLSCLNVHVRQPLMSEVFGLQAVNIKHRLGMRTRSNKATVGTVLLKGPVSLLVKRMNGV